MIINTETVTHAFEITLHKKMMIPVNLAAKLMSQASINTEKENHFSIHTICNHWGIENPLYQELMEFLASANNEEFSYFQLGRNKTNPIMIGSLEKFDNSLYRDFYEKGE